MALHMQNLSHTHNVTCTGHSPHCVHTALHTHYLNQKTLICRPIKVFYTHGLAQIYTLPCFSTQPHLLQHSHYCAHSVLLIHELGHPHHLALTMPTHLTSHAESCLLHKYALLPSNALAPALNFVFPCTLKTSSACISLCLIPLLHVHMILVILWAHTSLNTHDFTCSHYFAHPYKCKCSHIAQTHCLAHSHSCTFIFSSK